MTEHEYEEILEYLDDQDRQYILVDYDIEEPSATFRWEYAHEGITESDSVFRKINPY